MAAITKNALAQGMMEFSKRMVTGVLVMFVVQVILSIVIMAFNQGLADALTGFMSVCTPVYITGIVGYSAKAGGGKTRSRS